MAKSEKKKNVVIELPDELKEKDESSNRFLPPFILGVAVSFVLTMVPTISGIYWFCKDIPAFPSQSCPVIIRKKSRNRGALGFLPKQQEELLVELPPPQDPIACGCQLGWKLLGTFQGKETKSDSQQQPSICTPKVIEGGLPSAISSSSRAPDPKLKEKYSKAFTPERLEMSSSQKDLISRLAEKMRERIPGWEERASKTRWGGPSGPQWLDPIQKSSQATDLEALEGGSLYYSYLRIMGWPENLFANFPFKLCAHGCHSEEAVRHSLEFREKYKPWMASPAVKAENSKGCVYFHGFSPSYRDGENGSHGVAWIRPGQRDKKDDVAYTRAFVETLERSIARSLEHSNGRVGKFNVIVDGNGFSWTLLPSLHYLKTFVTILQDHFPDRLGIILLIRLGRIGEFVVKLFLPLITEEVRKKIIVLPHQEEEKQRILETVVGYENIPTWLGGTDKYEFNADEYYSNKDLSFSDEEANEYLTTMPYHA